MKIESQLLAKRTLAGTRTGPMQLPGSHVLDTALALDSNYFLMIGVSCPRCNV